MLSGWDEWFGHQTVAPYSHVEHMSPLWAERCYHLLHATPQVTLSVGRSYHPIDAQRQGFAGLTVGTRQYAVRWNEAVEPGDVPDSPSVGPLRVDVVEPLRTVSLSLADPTLPFGFDLQYEYRAEPVLTDRNRIEVNGEVVTDYINFFASGRYSGSVVVDGEALAVNAPGFRDRGWGLRKHEGAPRRGLVLGMFSEFEDHAIYALLYETGSGRRVMSNGWRLRPDRPASSATDISHDLTLIDGLLEGGRIGMLLDGDHLEVEFKVENRVFLSSLGYTPHASTSRAGEAATFDLRDRATLAALAGQTDHGIAVTCGGRTGTGYVEVGLGVHPRYSPDGGTLLMPPVQN